MPYRRGHRKIDCPKCERSGVDHEAKGLCRHCYQRSTYVPRAQRRSTGSNTPCLPLEDRLDDWEHMRHLGFEQAAARMGLTPAGLDKILYRARKKGDPRGYLLANEGRRDRSAA